MRNEDGYAVLEAFLVGLVLLLPLMWLLSMGAELHRSALASASAVREGGLAASRAAAGSEAAAHARSAVGRAFAERGIDPGAARVTLSWRSVPARGAAIELEVKTPVRVLRVPFLRAAAGPAIWIRARHVSRVEPYRSKG